MEASTVREEKEQGTGILLQDAKIRVFQHNPFAAHAHPGLIAGRRVIAHGQYGNARNSMAL
jgi:hypothetical protein